MERAPLTLLAVALALAALDPVSAVAQVAAPTLVEEDLPPEEPSRARRAEGEPQPEPPPQAQPPAPAAAPKPPEAPPPRAIEPVRARLEDLLAASDERRRALREQDPPRAERAERRLLALARELAIENFAALAVAEVRASGRALEARAPGEALSRAELAVKLAPDLPDGHVALARAHLARGEYGAALGAVGAAVSAAAREPHVVRAFAGDLLAAALAAVLVAAAAAVVLLFLRRARLLLHDVRHLPIVRHAGAVQASFLAVVLLALPLALHLGPAAILAVLAIAAALHLSRSERLLATAALCAVAALPWAAQTATRACAFTGTLADDVWEVQHGADADRAAARLEARAARGELSPPALVALGLHRKRRGDLEGAARLYEAAGPSRADATVDLGNVQLLRGDEEAAKASYLAATDRAGGDVAVLAAAHYNLSKIYLRHSALEQAQEARKRALQEDAAVVEAHGLDDDARANRWVIDVPVGGAEVRALASDDAPRAVGDAVRARLAGPLPPFAWPWALLAAAAVPWVLALLRRRAAPSGRCERCGGPACARCGGAAGGLCGQCVNVFTRKGVVAARDRLRKEAQVRRRARLDRLVTRTLAVATGGAGHLWAGAPWRGALLLLGIAFFAAVAMLWRGVVPPPHPSPWAAAGKLAVAIPCAGALWVGGVLGAFSRTRR